MTNAQRSGFRPVAVNVTQTPAIAAAKSQGRDSKNPIVIMPNTPSSCGILSVNRDIGKNNIAIHPESISTPTQIRKLRIVAI